ncbi:MAG: hypothetical protein GEV07_18975 [Streptosporangiales bacterium]|nr:hypothetical protein [Streptosporangiales bacterium]
MSQVIVPAGLMLGEFHAADASDEQPEYWHLNVGGYAEQLTALETTVWAAAMADPEKQSKLKGTREALRLALRTRSEAPISDPEPVIDDLLSRRALAQFDPTADNLESFGSSHRLLPLGIGLGNTHDDPENYRIAVAGEARVSVNGDIYALWSNSQHYPNLWESCAAFAKEAFGDGPQPDTNSVLQALAVNIPLLVATEVAILAPILD